LHNISVKMTVTAFLLLSVVVDLILSFLTN